jgi:hypothetical protein
MRNGTIHGAEVEERILAAFAQQADALRAELRQDLHDFWGSQLPVVDALLNGASNKLAHRVEVGLAAAAAMLERRSVTQGEAVISVLRLATESAPLTADQRRKTPWNGFPGIGQRNRPGH